jgi:hypothetical protein
MDPAPKSPPLHETQGNFMFSFLFVLLISGEIVLDAYFLVFLMLCCASLRT